MIDNNTVVAGGLVGGIVYALSYFITKSVRITSSNYIEQLKQLRMDNKVLREENDELEKRNRELERERWEFVRYMESKGIHAKEEFKPRETPEIES